MGSPHLLLILTFFSILSLLSPTVHSFTCNSNSTCHSLIDYVLPNTTTIAAVESLFGVKNHRSFLGANSLLLSTPTNYTLPANSTVIIPFTCICINGSGVSNHRPEYKVQAGDILYHIAAEIFSGLVTFREIQAVNNILDANSIEIGQALWIPLPCSCDAVNGSEVVHYGHVVKSGSSVQEIADEYGTTEEILLKLNGLADPKALMADSVLDVPLKACSSEVNSSSLDYPLLVSNNTYVFTANNCVQCTCNSANNWVLQCEPSQVNTGNTTCPSIQCGGPSNLYLGNTTSTSCKTTCAYAGYTNQTIFTTLTNSTCTASVSGNYASKMGSGWIFALLSIHMGLLLLPLSW